jgi:hypothetical protein
MGTGRPVLVPESRVHGTEIPGRRGLGLGLTTGFTETDAGIEAPESGNCVAGRGATVDRPRPFCRVRAKGES